jgi:hypothetical protein
VLAPPPPLPLLLLLQVVLLHDEESWVRGSAAAALTHLASGGCAAMQSRVGQAPGAIPALVQVRSTFVICYLRFIVLFVAFYHSLCKCVAAKLQLFLRQPTTSHCRQPSILSYIKCSCHADAA